MSVDAAANLRVRSTRGIVRGCGRGVGGIVRRHEGTIWMPTDRPDSGDLDPDNKRATDGGC